MKEFISLLKVDLNRGLLSHNFAASTLFIVFVMLISCSGFITNTSDVVYLFGHALTGSGSNLFILCIAPIMPYGMAFASDAEDKVLPFWLIRAGTVKYAACKFIAAVIGGFFAVSVGIFIFLLGMSFFFPLFLGTVPGDSYGILLTRNRTVSYLFFVTIHSALSGALFAGAAIAVSAFIPNKFTVLAAPIVVYFVLMRLTTHAAIPAFLKADFLVQGIYPDVSPLTAFLYKLIPIAFVLCVFLRITIKRIKKRVGGA